MKTWIFKGLGFLATAGAAATTVLLTASSVGLKKSISETFPHLDGLMQERPEIVEELLKPEEPPKPKPADPPPPPPPPGPSGKPSQDDAPTPPSNDDQTQGDQTHQSQGQQPSGGGAASGAQGGVSGGSPGGVTCDVTDPETTLTNLRSASEGLLSGGLFSVNERASGIGDCLQQFKTAALTQPGPTSPGP